MVRLTFFAQVVCFTQPFVPCFPIDGLRVLDGLPVALGWGGSERLFPTSPPSTSTKSGPEGHFVFGQCRRRKKYMVILRCVGQPT